MAKFKTCEHCGAALDHGESCDCLSTGDRKKAEEQTKSGEYDAEICTFMSEVISKLLSLSAEDRTRTLKLIDLMCEKL